jgi:hypothetical protein
MLDCYYSNPVAFGLPYRLPNRISGAFEHHLVVDSRRIKMEPKISRSNSKSDRAAR